MMDMTCAACPPLLQGYAYVDNDCNHTACIGGWTRASVAGPCEPCPLGHYCESQTQNACGEGCTTAFPGAQDRLQCVGNGSASYHAVVVEVQSNLYGTSSTLNASLGAVCSLTLDRWIESWMTYGAYQGSAIVFQDGDGSASSLYAGLSFTVSAPKCVQSVFQAWFVTRLNARQTAMTTLLAGCLKSPIILSAPAIQVTLVGPAATTNGTGTNGRPPQRPTDAPVFLVEQRRWGQSRFETAWTLGFAAVMVGGLCTGLLSGCALALTRAHRNSLGHRWLARIKEAHRNNSAKGGVLGALHPENHRKAPSSLPLPKEPAPVAAHIITGKNNANHNASNNKRHDGKI